MSVITHVKLSPKERGTEAIKLAERIEQRFEELAVLKNLGDLLASTLDDLDSQRKGERNSLNLDPGSLDRELGLLLEEISNNKFMAHELGKLVFDTFLRMKDLLLEGPVDGVSYQTLELFSQRCPLWSAMAYIQRDNL